MKRVGGLRLDRELDELVVAGILKRIRGRPVQSAMALLEVLLELLLCGVGLPGSRRLWLWIYLTVSALVVAAVLRRPTP